MNTGLRQATMSKDSLRERLQSLSEQLAQGNRTDSEAVLKARLAQRAVQYAKPLNESSSEDPANVYDVLVFQLGQERYGVDVQAVRSVRPITTLTRVPGLPSFYSGVVNVRGQIVSVLDLRPFFGMTVETVARELVIVNMNGLQLGLLASHVEDVAHVPYAQVEPLDRPHTRGVTIDRLVLLNISALFGDERLIIGGDSL